MADESVKAAVAHAVDFALSTPTYSISLKIENPVLAGILGVGTLALGAYYLANKQSLERAIRNALEARNDAGVVDPEVRNIEHGSVLVDLHCHSEKSFLEFVEDFEAKKVRNRLEEEFTKIGFQGVLQVTIRNIDEVKRKVTEIRNAKKGEDTGIQEADAKSTVYPTTSIQEEAHTSTKRRASEASTIEYEERSAFKCRKLEEASESGCDNKAGHEEISAFKCRKLEEVSESGCDNEGGNLADIVFALDYSSSISEEDLRKEINFVKHLAKSWNVTSAALIVYGDDSPILIPFHSEQSFSEMIGVLTTETLPQSKERRVDLALTKAAEILPAVKPGSQNQHQLVVLISAGKQTSNEESNDDNDLLVSASEELYSRSIKVIIVPVGLETDFKELGLIVKRPQCLFPHSSFDDLTQARAQEIAVHIRETIDIDVYTKRKMEIFGEIPTQSTLWEQISLCSDVMEGAWYLLYDDHKKPNRPEKVKKLIRESIDNFHNKLVSDSKICISLAVFGPQGAGKSFFLNFLLNWGLSKINQGKDGPLPSGIGDSQTPLPIRVKHGSKVQVLLHRREKGMCQDVWFEDEELGIDTLSQVSHLLKTKFQEIENLSDAKCMELRGPFPVFRFLQEGLRVMTKSGHLELEVDVEFVDVPGRGANIGNESINIELSRADVVLFFQEGQAGRPVSAEDIAQIFRRREEFQFTSRPKLVHVFNDDREPPILSSCNFDLLQSEKKEDLDKAWSTLFSSGFEEGSSSGCYSDVRKRLPQLYGETLLDRLSEESDVVYFHPTNPGLLDYLKKMIADHVHNVKMKEAIHPFLQDVHWAAKKLRTRIGRSLTTEIKKSTCIAEDTVSVPFEMHCWDDELSDLAREFVDQAILPLQLDTEGAHPTFYHAFLNSEKTLVFLKDSLEASLDNFVNRLIAACNAASWATFQDFNELVEVLCRNRVQQFCENNAQTYLLHILKKVKIPKQRGKYKKLWPGASPEKKKEFCVDMVYNLLKQIVDSLMDLKGKRDNQYKKSHFHFRDRLIQDVNELLHVKCSHDDSKASVLKMLHGKLPIVIQFCTKSIREINPHPSLDVEKDTTLPEEMTVANAGNKPIPLESSHKKIIQDIANLLQPKKGRKRDCIGALETKLKLGKGALVLRQSQNAEEQHLWAKALVNVLSDKDHFDTPLPPSLTLDSRDPETEELLKLARKRLFAHQKSCATCKIVTKQAVPDDELHVKKASQDENCLEVWVSPKMCHILDTIRDGFVDPMQQIAPIFMPTIRPGPTADIRGNFFLEEDPWSKDEGTDDLIEEQDETVPEGEVKENKFSGLDLNIFLVVEKQHLKTLQSTVGGLKVPIGRNMMYVVLPQKGRGIGVTRAIIKSLVECLNFSLYWTIDDDVQYMYQFDANDRKWHKCSLVRGLLFGQRVFQTCLKKTVKEVSVTERFNLVKEVDQKYPNDDFKTTQSATMFLFDDVRFPQVLKNPGLLLSLFTHISEDCGGDTAREKEMKAFVQEFVEKCAKLLFHDSINHIAGVSIAHESSKRYDYMSKYPTADYMQSEQRYQVVLNNAPALKGMNFVTDDIIFHEDEDQVKDINKRNTPYWGVKGSDKSFCRALTLGGVIGYQVIRVVHSHKKLINVFDRVGPSYIGSQSPYGSEDEDEERQDVN